MKYDFHKILYIIWNISKYISKWFLLIPHGFTRKNPFTIVVKLDRIGDYVLFRNFLVHIKNSEHGRNKKLILVGNALWKDLALTYDKDVVDEFYFIDFNIKGKKYYEKIYTHIANYNCETIINPTHSRTNIVNNVVYHSKAKYRITCDGDDVCLNKIFIKLSNYLLFNKQINISKNIHFEFLRTKYFIENLTGQKLALKQPFFQYPQHIPNNLITIFPSASHENRRWHYSKYTKLIETIHYMFPQYIFQILGSESDLEIGNAIKNCLPNEIKCVNLCGTTSLSEMVQHIAKSLLLVANDTSAPHIGVSVKTPTICVSNGNHFGRFCPYPQDIDSKTQTIFPDDTFYDATYVSQYVKKFKYKSDLDINAITVESVFKNVIKILNLEDSTI